MDNTQMNRKLLIIIFAITFFHACGFKVVEKNLLIGTWAGCDQCGTYYEVIFHDSTYIYTIDGVTSMPIFGYYHVINSIAVEELGRTYELVMNSGRPDTICLYLKNNNNLETLGNRGIERHFKIAESGYLKFDSDPTMYDENSTYVQEFNERKSKYNCK
jgi:hypothetical protein